MFEVTLVDLPALRSYVACHADFTARFGVRHYLARSVVLQHLKEDETCKDWLAVNYVPDHKQPGHWGYRKLRAVLRQLGVLVQYSRDGFSRWQANYYQLSRPPHPTYSPYRSGSLLVMMLEAMEGFELREPKSAEEVDRLLTKAVGTRDRIPRFIDYGHPRVGTDEVFEAGTSQWEEAPV